MKKLLLLLLPFLLLSCTADENAATDTGSGPLLQKWITTGNGATDEVRYFYNGHKLKRVEYAGFKVNYTYSGNLIKKTEACNPGGEVVIRTIFNYDSQQRLLKATAKNLENGAIDISDYTYNQDNTIYVQHFSSNTNGETIALSETLTLRLNAAGDIERSEMASDYFVNTDYTYDAQNNPMRNVIGYSKLLTESYGIQHNLTSRTSDFDSSVYNYVYQYNADGYPITRTIDLFGNVVSESFLYQ